MNASTVAVVIQTCIALLGSAGLIKLIEAVSRRRSIKVEAADRVNEMTLEWAAAVRADAQAARNEVREARSDAEAARSDAREARTDMANLRTEIRAATATLRYWRQAILSPEATLAGLRRMAAAEAPGDNGYQTPGGF